MLMVSDKENISSGKSVVSREFRSEIPSPEVVEKPKRRKFPAEYKLRILKEVDSITQPGELGALLRREGIYASNIAIWKWQREKGELDALSPKKRGPKSNKKDPLVKRIKELERENIRIKKRLERAELIIDIQKKISEITGIPLKEIENEEEDL